VQNWIIDTVSHLIAHYQLDYVKWDWNRPLSEGGSLALPPDRQGEAAHRYVLGLYRVLDAIQHRFPHVLIEGCAGGGGRFDSGMLAYVGQIWTSDNTDAVDRLAIQFNTATLYPIAAISAHVSAVPNHQTGRLAPLSFRGRVASSAVLGYELDLRQLDAVELDEIRRQIAWYKQHRHIIQHGRYVPLRHTPDDTAWMFWEPSDGQGVVFWFQTQTRVNVPANRLPIQGLDAWAWYQLVDIDSGQSLKAHGTELMSVGLMWERQPGHYLSRGWSISRLSKRPVKPRAMTASGGGLRTRGMARPTTD
jgi:alpha-galactosidase